MRVACDVGKVAQLKIVSSRNSLTTEFMADKGL